MTIKNIFYLLITIKNLIIINLIILFKKMLGKKIIIFYHSKGNLKRISDYYIKPLLQLEEKKIFVLIKKNLEKYIIVKFFMVNMWINFIPMRAIRILTHLKKNLVVVWF